MSAALPTSAEPIRSTMLDLVVSLSRQGLCEERVVEQARSMIHDGRVLLTGNFAGCRVD
jgi:hypothetical protein